MPPTRFGAPKSRYRLRLMLHVWPVAQSASEKQMVGNGTADAVPRDGAEVGASDGAITNDGEGGGGEGGGGDGGDGGDGDGGGGGGEERDGGASPRTAAKHDSRPRRRSAAPRARAD